MGDSAFDIYRSASGQVVVTNPVRRQILDALAAGSKELPELVALTGKAKPTLSSVHMKDLLEQQLIETVPHPTDNRRKSYRLIAKKIEPSKFPVGTPYDTVDEHVDLSPLAARFPLAMIMEVLASAPPGTDPTVLREQAAALGRRIGILVPIMEPEGIVVALARFLEQEGLARALRVDLEHHAAELAYGVAFAPGVPEDRFGMLLAGFASGVAQNKGHPDRVHLETIDGEQRCIIRFDR